MQYVYFLQYVLKASLMMNL